MMGSRGTTNGDECDALSRRARRLLSWRRGEIAQIKRGFAKRKRREARRQLRQQREGSSLS